MLRAQAIQIRAGQKILVDDVSLHLTAGESLALMGASGSGKSLIAMTLAGLLAPNLTLTQGSVQVAQGRPALIMQNPADCFDPLFPLQWAFHETFCHCMSKGDLADFTQHVLSSVGFEDPQKILQSYPFELSGGMLHRCMLALALGAILAGTASCIIADEPLSGLDTPSRWHILHLLQRLQKKYSFALLYIDHDLSAAAYMAQRIAIMHEGRVVEQGDFTQVTQQPQHEVTKNLVQAYERLQSLERVVHVKKKSAEPQGAPLLQACAVSKSYSHKKVLDAVSLELFSGQSVGLVGANGAGKSTFIRMLLGLERADSGHMTCCGHNIERTAAKAPWRKHLQAVFQHARLAVNPRMRVCDILLEPIHANKEVLALQNKAAEADKVVELLKLVDLPPSFAQKYPLHMSGGQLQRLCLARALALQPKVLLLDESLADLDAVVAEQLQEKLQELKTELGLSYLYISHDIRSVLRLCENIAVLHEGRLVDFFAREAFLAEERHTAFTTLLCQKKYFSC